MTPIRRPREYWRTAGLLRRLTHTLWRTLFALVGGDSDNRAPPPEPCATPAGLDQKIARIGTTIAQRQRQHRKPVETRDRPKTRTPASGAPGRPKTPASAPKASDPLAQAIDRIAHEYLIYNDRRWRRARAEEQLETEIAQALVDYKAAVPPEARRAVARLIACRLRSYAGDRYGRDPRTDKSQDAPSPYDREFHEDFKAAGDWPTWMKETLQIWRAERAPGLVVPFRIEVAIVGA